MWCFEVRWINLFCFRTKIRLIWTGLNTQTHGWSHFFFCSTSDFFHWEHELWKNGLENQQFHRRVGFFYSHSHLSTTSSTSSLSVLVGKKRTCTRLLLFSFLCYFFVAGIYQKVPNEYNSLSALFLTLNLSLALALLSSSLHHWMCFIYIFFCSYSINVCYIASSMNNVEIN